MTVKDVKFIFACPLQNKVFESSDFAIVENRGVITDKDGNKTLDAKVALDKPCPFAEKNMCIMPWNYHVHLTVKVTVEMQEKGKDQWREETFLRQDEEIQNGPEEKIGAV